MSWYYREANDNNRNTSLLFTETWTEAEILSACFRDAITDGGMGVGFLSLQRVLEKI